MTRAASTVLVTGCSLVISNVLYILESEIFAYSWASLVLPFAKFLIGQDKNLWQNVSLPLKIFQTAAIMEVVHSAIGFVRSGVLVTLFQISSRVFSVWGICYLIPDAQKSLGLPLELTAWIVTEVVRYSFYAFNLVGSVPRGLVWARYTFFFLLYPLGVIGELLCIFASLSYVKEHKVLSMEMPNPLNFVFSYYHFIILVILMYIPCFPFLYIHLIKQRKKVLGQPLQKKAQ